jgi:GT2 family glycosyltransferase
MSSKNIKGRYILGSLISIIIVNYHVKKELFDCLRSLYRSNITVPFEIIIVDHDETPTIEKELNQKFSQVRYVSHNNVGWGGGTNVGVRLAKGQYLFFLNPDCIVLPDAISILYQFLQKHKKVAIVSSLLLDKERKPYGLQATAALTPLRAVVAYSFLNKRLPKNSITRNFWLLDWDRKETRQVSVAPLSSALVRKDIFEKAGGFDEQFFLYFEEYDLAKRVAQLGYTSYLVPSSQVVHLWGVSTKVRNDANEVFKRSRFLYFKKYYGVLIALVVEGLLRIKKI